MSDHPHDPDQPFATRHGPEHALERLIFFSDAVFAIAITLLVIEIEVPHVAHGAGDVAFINALAALIPNFIGFVVSFFVIGAFWGGHHRAFGCAAHWHDRLMAPNIHMLLAIAAMPFFTAFMSEYNNQRVPVVAYCLWLLVTALLNVRLQRAATRKPVVDETVSAETIHRIRLRGWATVCGAVAAVAVAVVSPIPFAALASLMTMPLWRIGLTRAIRQKSA